MLYKRLFILLFIASGLGAATLAPNDKRLNGSWHLRVLDGMEVRKARAIVEFDIEAMRILGFDSCNRIGGKLELLSEQSANIPMIRSTRMACRNRMQGWVSKRLHEALKEGFKITKEKQYGTEGILLESATHTLFFKKMEKKSHD